MNGSEASRFALYGGVIALAGAPVALIAVRRLASDGLLWAAAGWLVLAVIGVVGGARVVGRLGRSATGVLSSLAGSMLLRLVVVPAGAAAAVAVSGSGALWGWLAGVVAGYVPVQVFELYWLASRTRAA